MASISISALGSSSSSSAIKPSSSVRHRFHSKNNPPLLFHRQLAPQSLHHPHQFNGSSSYGEISHTSNRQVVERRRVLISSIGLLAVALFNASKDGVVLAAEFADMPALRGKDYGKTKMRYPDYTETESGLQYKDLRQGSGPKPKMGETVVVDWDGYTIGYYGRIFEARNKTKGGSFEGDDKDYFKFRLGSQDVIPAFEEAVSGMALGGVRRIIVPPEIGYPENDYNKSGPRPTTFSFFLSLFFGAKILMYALIRPDVSTQVNVTEDVWLKIGSYFSTHELEKGAIIIVATALALASTIPFSAKLKFSELRRKWDSNGQDECNGNNVDGMAAFANTCDMTEAVSMAGYDGCGWVRHQLHH
ncbi:peptidyl-prolyl cis-trans isomerase FKBP19 [Citrus sinensis]|uniref:Peptidyl-prolyl cis-trans isomerase FKBP19 n=1 Tax=Citrus sinensis TaxID=2711 RepID=A0ACB8IPJ1_CITSI|nr:peptidyl-prolyl cis-trans isomerase FKBP19 [Citrus sinensis]